MIRPVLVAAVVLVGSAGAAVAQPAIKQGPIPEVPISDALAFEIERSLVR